jgi:hypothetical protein
MQSLLTQSVGCVILQVQRGRKEKSTPKTIEAERKNMRIARAAWRKVCLCHHVLGTNPALVQFGKDRPVLWQGVESVFSPFNTSLRRGSVEMKGELGAWIKDELKAKLVDTGLRNTQLALKR